MDRDLDQADNRGLIGAAAEIVAALDEVPSPTALLDERGIIRWQNKTSLGLRGSRTGRHFAEFVSSVDAQNVIAAFEQARDGGTPADVYARALDTAGKYIGLHGRWNGIELRDGTKVVVVLSLGDIHEPEEPTPASGSGDMLTRRQREVLGLLDQGYSTAEIAAALTLSGTTVRNHVAGLLAALGVHSRLQAVSVARAAGILDR